MNGPVQIFEFRQCSSLLKSAGRKAGTLRDLRDGIAEISEDSLFHHTCQYFLKGHILEYTNDFAQWVGENLEERALAERLSNIDPFAFRTLTDVRAALVAAIGDYLEHYPEPREALPGDEFHFNETVTFVFPSGLRARNLAEFLVAIRYVDGASIYFHFYEARMRLGGGRDDFSTWMERGLGKAALAAAIRDIDPFMRTIEGIRARLTEVVDEELRAEMEGVQS